MLCNLDTGVMDPLFPEAPYLPICKEPILEGFAQVSLALRFKNLPSNVSIQQTKNIPQYFNK